MNFVWIKDYIEILGMLIVGHKNALVEPKTSFVLPKPNKWWKFSNTNEQKVQIFTIQAKCTCEIFILKWNQN
jgi:hypothetical protein